MAVSLFNDIKEAEYFYNLLASRKLKDKRSDRANYEAELEENLNRCGEILLQHGARCNFIAEIETTENNIAQKEIEDAKAIDSDIRPRFSESYKTSSTSQEDLFARKEALMDEFVTFIQELPRDVREDLEFFSKKIIDRRNRRKASLIEEENLMVSYPEAEHLDYNDTFSALESLFRNIVTFSGEEFVLPTDKVVEEPKQEITQEIVDNIIEVPNDLPFELLDEQEELPEIEAVEEVSLDTIIPPAPEEPEPIQRKVVRIKSASQALLDSVNGKEEVVEEENYIILEPTPEPMKFDLGEAKEEVPVEVVSSSSVQADPSAIFEMQPGMSLEDLALALCDNKKAYEDIYFANKEMIDQRMREKNLDFTKVETYKDELSGLVLVIPTEQILENLNKPDEPEQGMTLAA